ncbi:MAG: late competence development ComFB family protein [Spirochaetales bacterium]|nr:late competence development ComFB family protein [Spirochaetales bacterium]
MGIREDYNFELLVNAAERLVQDELEKQLKEKEKICKCQDCILDMAAYALNKTKPYYRVSLLGKLYSESAAGSEYGNEVKKIVAEAIKKIGDNPSHE